MNETIQRLLKGEWDNHILPFFWQHGEDEATLREYMRAIHEANCGAVCVESRPHPDFCGEKWWRDLDVILDEARKRDMKVWILDDSHFPTGFANGAVKTAPVELHRQSVCANTIQMDGVERQVEITLDGLIPPPHRFANMMEQYVYPALTKDAPHFDDDAVIALTAVSESGETITIPYNGESTAIWQKPEGAWTVWVVGLSRNCSVHREYINMLDPASCRLLIDAVYETHWQHYAADFGKTIAGFFSDEPELGNGHLYFYENWLGTDQDLPFASTMPAQLETRLGADWANRLYLLWDNSGDSKETAFVRHAFMDTVTKLLRENFSRQIGDWCRAHGVKYIGHMIEDDNAHARTGSSLGHYFRGLDGQDMAGIDDIGGQVLPQGEEEPKIGNLMAKRDGEFYHYMMGNLAASAAAIEPGKHGDAMCEIFGNYGWAEGVRLEKYLADHFLARGVNHFVPHAFSPAPFPDPDCPPHFYAHGHNPQYRHFGKLMAYMNRVATLISGGRRVSKVAVLYHGEAEWAGEAQLSQKVARKLYEAQIEFDTIPADAFAEREHYKTVLGNPLRVNTQAYETFIIPKAQFLPKAVIDAAAELIERGLQVIFIDTLPEGISDADEPIPETLAKAHVLGLDELVGALRRDVIASPESTYLRVMHYDGKAEFYFFVNEAAEPYYGTVAIPVSGPCYWYDAWENKIYPAALTDGKLPLDLEPLKSKILVLGEAEAYSEPVTCEGKAVELRAWTRSQCAGISYPAFEQEKAVVLPDDVSLEQPEFSGFLRYETSVRLEKGRKTTLEITDAYEGVELFVNGQSLGIQIAPPFRYDISDLVTGGENRLTIEVATTLERQMYNLLKNDPRSMMRGLKAPETGSGLVGTVKLYTI
jgi:hypothetical protein